MVDEDADDDTDVETKTDMAGFKQESTKWTRLGGRDE